MPAPVASVEFSFSYCPFSQTKIYRVKRLFTLYRLADIEIYSPGMLCLVNKSCIEKSKLSCLFTALVARKFTAPIVLLTLKRV